MYQYHWPERPSSNNGRIERITSVIACLLSMIALLKKYERASDSAGLSGEVENEICFCHYLLTALLSKMFWKRYSLWTSSKQNLPLKIHRFRQFEMVLPCFFATFFRHIWALIFLKGEPRNLSHERYSLGPVEIGAWCRPPALFAAMFSELATKETIFQPCSYPPAAHRVMTHSKALILSKLFHTAQTGNQHKVCKVKHNLRLHPHWDLFNCIVYCLLYIFVSKCLYSDIQYLMILLHSTFDVLEFSGYIWKGNSVSMMLYLILVSDPFMMGEMRETYCQLVVQNLVPDVSELVKNCWNRHSQFVSCFCLELFWPPWHLVKVKILL